MNSALLPYCEGCFTQNGEEVKIPEGKAAVPTGGVPDLLLSSQPFPVHVRAIRANRDTYFADLTSCINAGIAINPATRARVLAAAWAVGEKTAVDDLLRLRDFTGVNEVLKALQVCVCMCVCVSVTECACVGLWLLVL